MADVYLQRGKLSQARGELDKALADYGRALAINPKSAEAKAALNQPAFAGRKSTPAPVVKGNFQPRPRVKFPPVYPIALRKSNITGEVIVEFIVTTNGDVVNACAIQATHPLMAAAAVEAVSLWKFYPGTIEGRPVNTRLRLPMSFALEEDAPSAKKL